MLSRVIHPLYREVKLSKMTHGMTSLHTFGNKMPAEKAMAPHSSTLAWKIPWMEEAGRLQSMGLQRVRHD